MLPVKILKKPPPLGILQGTALLRVFRKQLCSLCFHPEPTGHEQALVTTPGGSGCQSGRSIFTDTETSSELARAQVPRGTRSWHRSAKICTDLLTVQH